jgi:two-component system CheB/CheR fusion protein
VVVNQDLEIVQFRGSTGLFLEPSPGKASLNLLRMAKPGLTFELRNTIHKASRSDTPVRKADLEVKVDKTVHHVTIEVSKIQMQEGEEKLFLVIFQETEAAPHPEIKNFSKDKLVKQLQEELRTVREDMRTIVEEQEASNEELQSANEEIVSSNEELQSINEELETSKEEVESTNEELMTINTELQVRNEQLAEAVFGTIREAILVLDQGLRVRTANRAFYKIFHLSEEETQGMLIYELSNRGWNIRELRELLEDVLPASGQFHNLEIRHTFPGAGEKILVINAKRVIQKIHRQQLTLLAIEDITELKVPIRQ